MTRFNPCWHFWHVHISKWFYLPPRGSVAEACFPTWLVRQPETIDHSTLKKSSLLLTHLTAVTWSSLHGFSTVTVDSATWSPAQQHEAATLSLKTNAASAPRGQKTSFDIKKISPWSKHVLVYQELKAQKSHPRHRSGCSTLLRVPFRKLLVYVSLFISKYS